MADIASSEDREKFSKRLLDLLAHQDCGRSITAFATAFNCRHLGRPVTVHAARKWVKAEAIPTQDKIIVLAAWLGVSAAWLRFGEGPHPISIASVDPMRASLAADVMVLTDEECVVVRALINAFVKVRANKRRGQSN